LSKSSLHLRFQSAVFSREVINLSAAVSEILAFSEADSVVPANVKEEWEEFFSEGIFSALINTFVRMSSRSSSSTAASAPAPEEEAYSRLSVLRSLGPALRFIPDKQLFEHRLEPKYFADDVDSVLPEKLLFLVNHLCPMVAAEEVRKAMLHIFALTRTHTKTQLSVMQLNYELRDFVQII
jgi:hypothetical protein